LIKKRKKRKKRKKKEYVLIASLLLYIPYEKRNINNFLLGKKMDNYNNNKGGRNKGIMLLIWCDLISDGVGNNIIRRKQRQKKVERDVENIRYPL
jgi:hypothetical protein